MDSSHKDQLPMELNSEDPKDDNDWEVEVALPILSHHPARMTSVNRLGTSIVRDWPPSCIWETPVYASLLHSWLSMWWKPRGTTYGEGDCLRHHGWSQGGPIILPWTVLLLLGGTTYSMTGLPKTDSKTNRNAAVTCVLVAILGSPKSFVCRHKSAFSFPCIQPSVRLSTWCAGSLCSMYNTMCVSLSLLSRFLCCACVCILISWLYSESHTFILYSVNCVFAMTVYILFKLTPQYYALV